MKYLRKVLWYSFLSISVTVLLVVIFHRPIVGFLLHDLPFIGTAFSKAKWDNALKCSSKNECIDVEMACARGPMFNNLKRNYLNGGMSKESVERLLGTARPDPNNPSCVVYELGMCSGFKIDYDSLFICFDPHEKIRSVNHS